LFGLGIKTLKRIIKRKRAAKDIHNLSVMKILIGLRSVQKYLNLWQELGFLFSQAVTAIEMFTISLIVC
ncbi:MAG: hypothetical protein WAM14_26200, partial [Candidatus Nitrosopolaris sp.]